jgi:hypothetical protein
MTVEPKQNRGLLIRGLVLIIVLLTGWVVSHKRAEMLQQSDLCEEQGWQRFHANGFSFCYPPDVFGVMVLDKTIKLTGFFVVNDNGKPRTCAITLKTRPGLTPTIQSELVSDDLHPAVPERRQREIVNAIIRSLHR